MLLILLLRWPGNLRVTKIVPLMRSWDMLVLRFWENVGAQIYTYLYVFC